MVNIGMYKNKLHEKILLRPAIEPSIIDVNVNMTGSIYVYDLFGVIDAGVIKNSIIDYKNKNENSNKTYVNAWHSYWHIHKETNLFDEIVSLVEDRVTKILRHNNGNKIIYATMAQCWAIIYTKDNFTERHKHFDQGFSAVYYASVEKNPSPLVFDNDVVIVPKTNMLVCFPGYIYHSVPKMTEDEKRICLAFNLNCTLPEGIRDE